MATKSKTETQEVLRDLQQRYQLLRKWHAEVVERAGTDDITEIAEGVRVLRLSRKLQEIATEAEKYLAVAGISKFIAGCPS